MRKTIMAAVAALAAVPVVQVVAAVRRLNANETEGWYCQDCVVWVRHRVEWAAHQAASHHRLPQPKKGGAAVHTFRSPEGEALVFLSIPEGKRFEDIPTPSGIDVRFEGDR